MYYTKRGLISKGNLSGMIMKKTLSITVISKACGINPPTIRIWEKRYAVFSPDRTEGGQRLYSEDDLAKAKLIASLIEKGHSISSLAPLSVSELRNYLQKANEEKVFIEKKYSSSGVKKIVQHIENFNIDMIAGELQYQRTSIGAKDFIFKIILPVMQEIGLMVANGQCSVTQEHIVSTIVRDQLSKINLPNMGKEISRFALATPEGNLHELSILIADVICRANRVSTSYLGAAHPAQCLGEAVSALHCKTIVMGVISSDQWDYQKNIIPYLEMMDKHLKGSVKVILGGGWELKFPKFKNIEEVIVMKSFEDLDKFLVEQI